MSDDDRDGTHLAMTSHMTSRSLPLEHWQLNKGVSVGQGSVMRDGASEARARAHTRTQTCLEDVLAHFTSSVRLVTGIAVVMRDA